MKNYTLLILIVLLSCKEGKNSEALSIVENSSRPVTQDPQNHKTGFVDSVLIPYQQKVQTFNINGVAPQKIIGKRGTILFVEPSNLETIDGSRPGKNIELHLIELRDKMEMLSSNVQTVSDDRLLVSGGAYFIDLSSEGKKLKLKSGASMNVIFPKNSNSQMELFYGQKDEQNNMNWMPAGRPIEAAKEPEYLTKRIPDVITSKVMPKPGSKSVSGNITMKAGEAKKMAGIALADDGNYYLPEDVEMEYDTVFKEVKMTASQKMESDFYDQIALQQFGWINCDYFYRNPAPADLIVSVSGMPKNTNLKIFSIYNSMNSLLSDYATSNENGELRFIKKIPSNESLTIIALGSSEGKLYGFKKEVINNDKHKNIGIAIKAEPVSEQQLKSFLSNNKVARN